METTAEVEIRTRITRQGKITFAEFMEVALYHREAGYYSRRASAGARGDYYTSPEAHPAFGALIAVLLSRMWEVLGCPSRFHAIEMGAGSGLLARDVVQYAPSLNGAFGGALTYVALDQFPVRLPPDSRPGAYQRVVASGAPFHGVVGCLLSNELVDSVPVHRFQIDQGSIKEVYVGLRQERFVEVLDKPSTTELAGRIERLGLRLPDGYRGEVNLELGAWMAGVAGALKSGFVLTIDYGHEASDLYSLERAGGTVETFYRHTQSHSPYERVGIQDITAHVDFSSVISEGDAVGLKPVGMCTQSECLGGLGLGRWLRRLRTQQLEQRELDANVMAMRELVKPDGLGGFKVLVQEKDTGITDPGQLFTTMPSPDGPGSGAEDLPVPLLRPEHLPLMEGRYPHAAWRPEELWPHGEERR